MVLAMSTKKTPMLRSTCMSFSHSGRGGPNGRRTRNYGTPLRYLRSPGSILYIRGNQHGWDPPWITAMIERHNRVNRALLVRTTPRHRPAETEDKHP